LYKYKQTMSNRVIDILRKLFSSTIRTDLLVLLLNNPDEKFYVREIAGLLRKNVSGVKRELDNLEGMGILTSKKVANLKYFHANKKSPIFLELKSLIAKSLGVSDALKSLLKTSGAKIAFIHGPYTESEDAGTVNLFLVGQSSLADDDIKDIEGRFNKKINISVMDEVEFKNKKEGSDADLEKLLSENTILLMGKL